MDRRHPPLKDPLDSTARPFEVLGISPDASPAEAGAAYSNVVRDLSKRRAAGAARDRMTRTDCRLEDEFFYYPSDAIDLVRIADPTPASTADDEPRQQPLVRGAMPPLEEFERLFLSQLPFGATR